jgi:hypothetical protein
MDGFRETKLVAEGLSGRFYLLRSALEKTLPSFRQIKLTRDPSTAPDDSLRDSSGSAQDDRLARAFSGAVTVPRACFTRS